MNQYNQNQNQYNNQIQQNYQQNNNQVQYNNNPNLMGDNFYKFDTEMQLDNFDTFEDKFPISINNFLRIGPSSSNNNNNMNINNNNNNNNQLSNEVFNPVNDVNQILNQFSNIQNNLLNNIESINLPNLKGINMISNNMNNGDATIFSKCYIQKLDNRNENDPIKESYQSQSINQFNNQHNIQEKQEAYKNSKGLEKAAYQRMLDGRGAKLIRQRNRNTGEQEEHQIFKGMNENDLNDFNNNYNDYRQRSNFQKNYEILNKMNPQQYLPQGNNYNNFNRGNNYNNNNMPQLPDNNFNNNNY